MHEQAIQHYFADKEPMLVEAVSRLVRIDSTLGPALPGKPFGEGPAAALEELLALCLLYTSQPCDRTPQVGYLLC